MKGTDLRAFFAWDAGNGSMRRQAKRWNGMRGRENF